MHDDCAGVLISAACDSRQPWQRLDRLSIDLSRAGAPEHVDAELANFETEIQQRAAEPYGRLDQSNAYARLKQIMHKSARARLMPT